MSLRRIAAAGIGVTLLVTLAACTSKSGGSGDLSGGPVASAPAGTPSDSPTPAPAVTVTVTPTATGTTTTAPATPAYPSDYFAAILAAWKAHNTSYLTLLTDATTAAKFYSFGNINQTWHGLPGDGAMGTSYQTYYNNAGDAITLKASNQETSAKHWHAAGIETWDKMTFPNDAVAYVKRFVNAWMAGNKARMTLLGSSTLTTQILAITPGPDSTFTAAVPSGGNAAGHTYVEVKDPSASIDITLAVVNQYVGQEHAIESCYSGC